MAKVTMPEPVAVVCHGYDLFFVGGGPIADLVKRLGVKVGDWLITTEQAEVYAAARVREALEEAAGIIKANAEACDSGTRIMLRANAGAVLALLPSTPARPESEQ